MHILSNDGRKCSTSLTNYFICFACKTGEHCIIYCYVHFRLQRVIMNSQNNLFSVGLIAQLVEHCSGITEAITEQGPVSRKSR